MQDYMISIIIPVYNAEKYITSTIRSIITNGLDDVEIICVDDGSNDHSLTKLKEYEKYPGISIIHQKNQGAPSARNAGLMASKGEYVWFFDSDDLMNNNAINQVKELIQVKSPDIIICNYLTIIENGSVIGQDDYKNNRVAISKRNKLLYLYLITPFPGAKLYRKSIIDEYDIRFDNVRIGQDLNFYLKFLNHIENFEFLDYFVSSYRIVEGSISRSFDYRILDIIKSIAYVKDHYDIFHDSERIRFLLMSGYSHFVSQYLKIQYIEDINTRINIQAELKREIQRTRKQIHPKDIYELYKVLKIDRMWSITQNIIKRKFDETENF